MIEELSEASRCGQLRQAIEPYTHTDVLVVDELGYLTYPMEAANVLFQVVDHRDLHKKPIVFTTDKPSSQWGRVLHDPDPAEAITDRVLERGRFIELRGQSHSNPPLAGRREGRIAIVRLMSPCITTRLPPLGETEASATGEQLAKGYPSRAVTDCRRGRPSYLPPSSFPSPSLSAYASKNSRPKGGTGRMTPSAWPHQGGQIFRKIFSGTRSRSCAA